MRNLFKSFLALIAIFMLSNVKAVDLLVEEFGVAPNFSSIQDAVDAAMPGDRIFIKNKAGNIPYFENVHIDKPLELHPAVTHEQFHVLGAYTIEGDPFNYALDTTIRIIGMHNIEGGILTVDHSTASEPILIDIAGCHLEWGNIDICHEGFVADINGNQLDDGDIIACQADIIGNIIVGNIEVNGFNQHDLIGDTAFIVGNRIFPDSSGQDGYIHWTNIYRHFFIANNFITSSVASGLIRVSLMRSGDGTNAIINNSLLLERSGFVPRHHSAIDFPGQIYSSQHLKIENNAYHVTTNPDAYAHFGIDTTDYMVRFGSPIDTGARIEIVHNVYEGNDEGLTNAATSEALQSGNVEAANTFSLSAASGVCAAPECLDGGRPSYNHFDHDLSINDVGVAGGSYNYNNFYPLCTGPSKVAIVKTARVVKDGHSIRVEAKGYDR